ncbi:MAG: hypothetical protein JW821_09115 [Deltaproteobacteria bacterium]|nr:hypothetical protein [Deltaproteobacteria bacterium]
MDIAGQDGKSLFVYRIGNRLRNSKRLLLLSLGFLIQPASFLTLAAKLPNDALRPKLAISTRVSAGLAGIETFLAIPDIHLLALHAGLSIRMKAAIHFSLPSIGTKLSSPVVSQGRSKPFADFHRHLFLGEFFTEGHGLFQ